MLIQNASSLRVCSSGCDVAAYIALNDKHGDRESCGGSVGGARCPRLAPRSSFLRPSALSLAARPVTFLPPDYLIQSCSASRQRSHVLLCFASEHVPVSKLLSYVALLGRGLLLTGG